MAAIFLLLGLIKCLRIMRRDGTSALCVSALAVALCGWLLSALFAVFMNVGLVPRFVGAVLGVFVIGLFPLAIVLAVIGLAQFKQGGFVQGRAQAIWGIVIGLGMLGAAATGFAIQFRKNMPFGPTAAARQVLEDRNFAITPPSGWLKVEPKALSVPDAAIAFRHFQPEIYAMVLTETLGDGLSVDAFAELVKQNLTAGADVTEQAEDEIEREGFSFRRIRSHARMKTITMDLYYEHWLLAHGGAFWQVVLWGRVPQKEAIQNAASRFIEGFEVLDRDRRHTAHGTFEDLDLAVYGIKTTSAGQGWNAFSPEGVASPLIRVAAERLNEAFIVLPIRSEEELPDLEALTSGLIAPFEFSYPIRGHASERAIDSPVGAGIELVTERDTESGAFEYIFRVVRNETFAYFLAGWASKKNGDIGIVRAAMDAVKLSPPVGPVPEWSTGEKAALANLYNHAGLSYVSRKNDAASLNWFKTATELDPTNGQYVANRSYILGQLGRKSEALELVEKSHKQFPKSFDLQTQRCLLIAEKGDVEAAQAEFLQLIERGMKDEEKLLEWVNMLLASEKIDLAEATLVQWNSKQPSPRTQGRQASVIASRGDLKRATEFLEQILANSGFNLTIAARLGDILNEAGEHMRAAEVAEKILASKPGDTDGLQILGWSQMGQKAYSQAKSTFEKAAAIFPNDEAIATALKRASLALGQGQNSDVKSALKAVPIPPELAKALEKPSIEGLETEGRPLITLARSTGYYFEKGKPARQTLRRRFRVLNQVGVNLLSSFEYSFHPSSERIYVNHLKVIDPEGKVIASGSVDDLFVRDAAGEMGTDEKILTIPVPGLRPDCVVDIEVTKEDRFAAKEFSLTRHTLGYRTPCAIESVYVTGDIEDVKTVVTNGERMKTVRTPRLLAWSLSRIQPIPDESYSPTMREDVPALVISSHAESWAKVGQDYLKEIAERLKPQSEVKELVQKLCSGLTSDLDKIRVLSREVQKTIGYKAIEFGVRARIPNSASDTLRYRYGDCKDQALLLHQMLKEAGIESHLALVHSSDKVLPDLPTLNQFNHMVLHVPALASDRLVDPTAKYYPLSTLQVPSVTDSNALIIDPAGSRLMPSTFAPALGTADVESRRTLRADGNDWLVTETITLKGYYAAGIRRSYDEMTSAEQMRQAQAYLAGDGTAEIKGFRFENLENLEEPAQITMSYIVRDAIKATNGKSVASLPALWERNYVVLDFLPERKTAFEWRYPFRIHSEITFDLPSGTSIQHIAQKGGGKGAKWTLASNGSASLSFDFQSETGRWMPKEYTEIYANWIGARRAWDSSVEWQ